MADQKPSKYSSNRKESDHRPMHSKEVFNDMSTWFITGCSTGLGRALARAVLDLGHNAVITARDITALQDLIDTYPDTALALPLDVTDQAQVSAAVHNAEARFGGIDVLVNNAGYGYRAAVEEGDDDEVRQLFATNFFGAVAMIKAVLPGMRHRRAGAIANISSISVRISPAGSGYYSATKAALEGLSGSLQKELQPLGITVMVVEPGRIRTDFAGRSSARSSPLIADYAETASHHMDYDLAHGTQSADPDKAAHAIITALAAPEPPIMLLLGGDALNGFTRVDEAQHLELKTWQNITLSTGH